MVVIGWLLDTSLGVFRAPLPHMQAKAISGRIPSALILHELHTSIVTRMQPLSRPPQAVTKGVHNLLLNHCDRLRPLEWGCSSKRLICALESLMCFLELVSETFNHTIRDNVAFWQTGCLSFLTNDQKQVSSLFRVTQRGTAEGSMVTNQKFASFQQNFGFFQNLLVRPHMIQSTTASSALPGLLPIFVHHS